MQREGVEDICISNLRSNSQSHKCWELSLEFVFWLLGWLLGDFWSIPIPFTHHSLPLSLSLHFISPLVIFDFLWFYFGRSCRVKWEVLPETKWEAKRRGSGERKARCSDCDCVVEGWGQSHHFENGFLNWSRILREGSEGMRGVFDWRLTTNNDRVKRWWS